MAIRIFIYIFKSQFLYTQKTSYLSYLTIKLNMKIFYTLCLALNWFYDFANKIVRNSSF